MDKFVIYFILLAVVCIKGAVGKNRDEPEPKIVGGNETTIEMYPYQVFLSVYDGANNYQCGGSIISEQYVLTAAHCLERIKEVNIRIGSTTSNSGGNVYKTSTFYIHPLYNNQTFDYDAGVVVVREGMKLDGTKAKAIKMVNIGYDPSENVNITITGWGNTKEKGRSSLILRETQVPVVSRSRCNQMVGGDVTNRMFCAGFLEGGKDTCQGDSGGPAVAESTGLLAGITSHGNGCARPNFPGIYTLIGNIQVRMFITAITLL